MIKVAIMGHGTVGSGVYEVFDMNADKIAKTVGEPVEVKYVLDLRDFSSLPYGNKFVTDFSVIENDLHVRGLCRRRHSGHPPDAAVPGCQRV